MVHPAHPSFGEADNLPYLIRRVALFAVSTAGRRGGCSTMAFQDVSISKRPRIVAPDAILGREAELAAADRFFDGVPQGPTALLIEGEAGIGKTTIWHEAVRRGASTSRVLVSRASENETKLSFTVLTDLLEPALDDAADRSTCAATSGPGGGSPSGGCDRRGTTGCSGGLAWGAWGAAFARCARPRHARD